MKIEPVRLVTAFMVAMLAAALGFINVLAQAQETGAALYKTKCAACHGPDGKGETTMGKAAKLRDMSSAEVQQQSDADLTGIITNGKGKMPPYGKSLKPEQIKELVSYVRSLAKK